MNIIATIIVSMYMMIQTHNAFALSKKNGATTMFLMTLILVMTNACIVYAIWK